MYKCSRKEMKKRKRGRWETGSGPLKGFMSSPTVFIAFRRTSGNDSIKVSSINYTTDSFSVAC